MAVLAFPSPAPKVNTRQKQSMLIKAFKLIPPVMDWWWSMLSFVTHMICCSCQVREKQSCTLIDSTYKKMFFCGYSPFHSLAPWTLISLPPLPVLDSISFGVSGASRWLSADRLPSTCQLKWIKYSGGLGETTLPMKVKWKYLSWHQRAHKSDRKVLRL